MLAEREAEADIQRKSRLESEEKKRKVKLNFLILEKKVINLYCRLGSVLLKT